MRSDQAWQRLRDSSSQKASNVENLQKKYEEEPLDPERQRLTLENLYTGKFNLIENRCFSS